MRMQLDLEGRTKFKWSLSPLRRDDWPHMSRDPPECEMEERLELIQSNMVQQGLIDMNMSNEQLREELERQSQPEQGNSGKRQAKEKQPKGTKQKA